MSRYSNGKVYIIDNNNNGDVFIGCTTRSLSDAMKEHEIKAGESDILTLPVHSYFHNRMSHEWNTTTWSMRLLKNVPCNSRKELLNATIELRNDHKEKHTDGESWCY